MPPVDPFWWNAKAKRRSFMPVLHTRLFSRIARFLPLVALSAALLSLAACHRPANPGEAALVDDTKTLTQMLDSGADINQRDADGYTALHWAAYSNKLESAKILVQRGANLESLDNSKFTPLTVAACYNQAAVASFLVEKGANVNAQEDNGWSPLAYAASNRNLGLVTTLVNNKADVNAKDKSGKSVLTIARSYRANAVVDFLISKGAKE
jgi:ankyrin repeat protein